MLTPIRLHVFFRNLYGAFEYTATKQPYKTDYWQPSTDKGSNSKKPEVAVKVEAKQEPTESVASKEEETPS